MYQLVAQDLSLAAAAKLPGCNMTPALAMVRCEPGSVLVDVQYDSAGRCALYEYTAAGKFSLITSVRLVSMLR